ncbi:MAG: CpsD/CapB family tyrosine-protein kinase [Deltaproteobacteria bacterium]|nr:CpsD/CapB family tyrosine-protein kinase [Deltaproteobacteria bacterium]
MGEIADALRRARRERSSSEAEQRPAPPRESPQQAAGAVSAAPEPLAAPEIQRLPPPERVVEALTPCDPAIALADSVSVEACRGVAVRLRSELERRGEKTVAIVSAIRGEGKTTVLCNLGLALASLSASDDLALVDLDLRKPSIARVLGVSPSQGVEKVLRGTASLEEVRISIAQPGLDVYPAAEPVRSAHELLILPSFAAMIRQLEQRYSLVVFDTPPTLLVPDTSLILQQVHACVPVARAGQTRARYLQQMLEVLPRGQILGEVLNCARTPRYASDYYRYGPEAEAEAGSKVARRSRFARKR